MVTVVKLGCDCSGWQRQRTSEFHSPPVLHPYLSPTPPHTIAPTFLALLTGKMADLIEQLDAKIAEVISGWNLYTSIIAFGLFAFVAYSLFMIEDPDTHPILLLRQSTAAPVRQSGESAVYRSHEVPHGYPLKTGLQVKPPGTPAYYGGKDGDLRDIWRRVTGELPLEQPHGRPQSEAPPSTQLGKILTVMGTERVIEHDIGELTRGINVIGSMLQKQSAKCVAVYLPNSVELLQTVFGRILPPNVGSGGADDI